MRLCSVCHAEMATNSDGSASCEKCHLNYSAAWLADGHCERCGSACRGAQPLYCERCTSLYPKQVAAAQGRSLPRCRECHREAAADVLARQGGFCWWCDSKLPKPIPAATGPATWGVPLPASFLPPGVR